MNGADGIHPWCTTIMGGLVCGRVGGTGARRPGWLMGARASCWTAGRELWVEQVHTREAEAAEKRTRYLPTVAMHHARLGLKRSRGRP